MRVESCTGSVGGGYVAELTDDERMALAWATEAGRALLLGDPDVSILTREAAISADLLDRLADALVLAGMPARPAAGNCRLAPRRQRTPHTR